MKKSITINVRTLVIIVSFFVMIFAGVYIYNIIYKDRTEHIIEKLKTVDDMTKTLEETDKAFKNRKEEISATWKKRSEEIENQVRNMAPNDVIANWSNLVNDYRKERERRNTTD